MTEFQIGKRNVWYLFLICELRTFIILLKLQRDIAPNRYPTARMFLSEFLDQFARESIPFHLLGVEQTLDHEATSFDSIMNWLKGADENEKTMFDVTQIVYSISTTNRNTSLNYQRTQKRTVFFLICKN